MLIWSLALSSFGGWPLGYPEMAIKGSKVLGVKRLECDTLFGCTSHNLELTEVVWALLFTQFQVYQWYDGVPGKYEALTLTFAVCCLVTNATCCQAYGRRYPELTSNAKAKTRIMNVYPTPELRPNVHAGGEFSG
jgi:hypothetical protein